MTTTACGGHLDFWKVDQQQVTVDRCHGGQVTVETQVVRGACWAAPRRANANHVFAAQESDNGQAMQPFWEQ